MELISLRGKFACPRRAIRRAADGRVTRGSSAGSGRRLLKATSERRPQKKCLVLLAVVPALAVALLAGCADETVIVGEHPLISRLRANERALGLPEIRITLADLRHHPGEPAWIRHTDATILATAFTEGQLWVLESTGWGSGTRVWLRCLNAQDGTQLSSRYFGRGTYRSGNLCALGEWVGCFLYRTRSSGVLMILDQEGRTAATLPLHDWSEAYLSPDGTVLGLRQYSRERLWLYSFPSLRLLGHLRVAKPDTVCMTPHGVLVLRDDGRAELSGWDGRLLWTSEGAPQQTPVSPSVLFAGGRFAVTGLRGEDRLRVYSASGELLWTSELVPGGRHRLTTDAEGRYLCVYDVGPEAGAVIFDAESGAAMWRVEFRADQDAESELEVTGAWLMPSCGLVAFRLVENPQTHVSGQRHSLCVLSWDGRPLWRLELHPQTTIMADPELGRIFLVDRGVRASTGVASDTIRCYKVTAPSPAGP